MILNRCTTGHPNADTRGTFQHGLSRFAIQLYCKFINDIIIRMFSDHEAMAIQMGLGKHSIGYAEQSKENFLCGSCLWTFKTETELGIHK